MSVTCNPNLKLSVYPMQSFFSHYGIPKHFCELMKPIAAHLSKKFTYHCCNPFKMLQMRKEMPADKGTGQETDPEG